MRKFCQKTKIVLLVIMLVVLFQICLYANKDPFLAPWEQGKKHIAHKQEEQLRLKQQFLQKEEIFYNKNKENEFDKGSQDLNLSPKEEEGPTVRPDLDLRGIIWSKDGAGMAIIGDKIFHTGDVIADGCVIGAIVDGMLILKCKDNVWKYRVNGGV